MSLQLHLSSRSDELLAKLRPRLSAARSASLQASSGIPRPIPVLVPSAQIGDWLQVRLARDLGLSMGFEFLQPRVYFGRHFATSAEAVAFAKGYAFWTPERMRWRILPAVDDIAKNLGHDQSQSLGPRDRFAFAQLLAQQFDRYARFRPDWPGRWDENQTAWGPGSRDLPLAATPDEAWQRQLWQTLATLDGASPHPAQLLSGLARATSEATEAAAPLFVVGTDLIDPLFLRTLEALSRRGHAITVFLLLPSLGYLGDISRRDRWRTQLATASPQEPLETGGHPLIASLGQQAVGTFLLLDSISPDYAHWPDDVAPASETPETLTLLRRLQTDIREQRLPAGRPTTSEEPDRRPALLPDDRSLRIHCCHSPRRELEVLRDELLRAFAELPSLQPDEVLIAVTDFDAYAPLAEGILRSGLQPLPVRLTAIPAREANPIAMALLALLRLSLGRRTASELVELLNLAALQHRLDVVGEAEALSRLADAVRHSGLTHGLDVTHRGNGDCTGTWRSAIDRHLAGAWLGPVDDARDASATLVHPLAGDLHHDDAAILRFMAWLTHLADHFCTWSEEAPAAAWAGRLETAVDDLLYSEILDDHAAAVRRLFGELAGVAATTRLDAGSMLDWLQPQLDNATSLRTSMGGEILLGRLDQIHGLPCRVLAMLGLQDGAFPRTSRRPAWDLLSHVPERWDVDPRTQDRQWFLDSILAPRDRLILSAANRSLRTPHDAPLSSCVEELLRVAGDTLRPDAGNDPLEKQLVVYHRIQPFAAEYFSAGSSLPLSFDAAAARIAGDIANAGIGIVHPFFSAPGDALNDSSGTTETLTLAQLIAFWKDPARAWLRAMHLDFSEDDPDDTALDEAPVTLDALQAYTVRATALSARMPSALIGASVASAQMAANRALPPGALGALAWELRDREIQLLATALAPLLAQAIPTAIDFPLTPTVRLTGEIVLAPATDGPPWVLAYRPSRYDSNPKYQIEAFILTLVATVHLNAPVACCVLGLDDSQSNDLGPIPIEDARRQLETLVTGYAEGQQRPLCFAPATSHRLVEALEKGNGESAALEMAGANWSSEPYGSQPGGEGTAPAATLAWRDADPFAPPNDRAWLQWANEVAAPLRRWWRQGATPTR